MTRRTTAPIDREGRCADDAAARELWAGGSVSLSSPESRDVKALRDGPDEGERDARRAVMTALGLRFRTSLSSKEGFRELCAEQAS